jgi:solute carrier family 25 phosphate transporter 23/24/25/41
VLRNFLLFLPTNSNIPVLKEVLSYYSSTVTLNAEGDTSISEETLEGLGRKSFLSALFGIIMKIAEPPKVPRLRPEDSQSEVKVAAESAALNNNMYKVRVSLEPQVDQSNQLSTKSSEDLDPQELTDDTTSDFYTGHKKSLLKEILPDPG